MNSYYSYLCHHGIRGQQWGKRNGPPYPLGGGDYSEEEMRALRKERKHSNGIYNKKHYDKIIKEGTKISTLSYDKDRTKNADMFYATYKPLDKHQYNALFNKPVKDENGTHLKYRITNVAAKDIKVASEDTGSNKFLELYKKDRDFYNFIQDPERMQGYFVDDKYKFKGYREARKSLDRIRQTDKPSESDIRNAYRMFNYVIPYDGAGNKRDGKDVANQRDKFFNLLKDSGYSAVLDTNDAIYGGFKASAPVIIFDQSSVLLKGADRVTPSSKKFSSLVFAGRKLLGV